MQPGKKPAAGKEVSMSRSSNQYQPVSTGKLLAYIFLFMFLIMISFLLLAAEQFPFVMLSLASMILAVVGLVRTLILTARRKPANPRTAPRPEKKEMPQLPKVRKSVFSPAQIPAEYQALLDRLQADKDSVEKRQEAVSKLIDNYFGGSMISAARYKQVMDNAEDVLEKNYENAQMAVDLFGSSRVTKTRLQIIQNYVDDSSDIIANIDRVIDELLKVQQSSVLENGDLLDQKLNELASTTSYYQTKESR